MRLAILLLALAAFDVQAAGGHAAGHAVPHMGGPHPAHVPVHGHVHGAVVVGAAFVGVGYWPGYYYPPAYYAPPPPPPVAYWYYCPQAGAYYPYTPSCPGPWQLVSPTPYTY